MSGFQAGSECQNLRRPDLVLARALHYAQSMDESSFNSLIQYHSKFTVPPTNNGWSLLLWQCDELLIDDPSVPIMEVDRVFWNQEKYKDVHMNETIKEAVSDYLEVRATNENETNQNEDVTDWNDASSNVFCNIIYACLCTDASITINLIAAMVLSVLVP